MKKLENSRTKRLVSTEHQHSEGPQNQIEVLNPCWVMTEDLTAQICLRRSLWRWVLRAKWASSMRRITKRKRTLSLELLHEAVLLAHLREKEAHWLEMEGKSAHSPARNKIWKHWDRMEAVNCLIIAICSLNILIQHLLLLRAMPLNQPLKSWS